MQHPEGQESAAMPSISAPATSSQTSEAGADKVCLASVHLSAAVQSYASEIEAAAPPSPPLPSQTAAVRRHMSADSACACEPPREARRLSADGCNDAETTLDVRSLVAKAKRMSEAAHAAGANPATCYSPVVRYIKI